MQNSLIIDVIACYKNIDENNVSAILEIKKKDSVDYEMIFKYSFSINTLEKNTIEVYKDLSIPLLYDLHLSLKDNPNYKGIFDIYFKVYQNDINNLRKFAIKKLNEVNNPKEVEEESVFEQVKDSTKKFFKEIWEEGSSNELNGTITKFAAYKKESKEGYANRYAIDIIRYGTNSWENIYSYEYGKYKIGGILTDVNNVSVYKLLSEDDIFKILSLVKTEEEYEVIKRYLKTTPKESSGEEIKIDEEKPKIENIKFL